jgi:hypothetical protein
MTEIRILNLYSPINSAILDYDGEVLGALREVDISFKQDGSGPEVTVRFKLNKQPKEIPVDKLNTVPDTRKIKIE